MNVNSINLVGRLTNDPEVSYVGEKNTAKAVMTVAVNRIGQKDKTDFILVEVWGVQAENVGRYLVKGQEVAVTGSMRVDSWKDRDDKWRSKAYVAADKVQFGNKPKTEELEEIPF